MNINSARGRGAAAFVASMALLGAGASLVTAPASSALVAGDCAAPFPVAELADGDAVDGLTVSEGTTPEAFTGEILGVINDGIAPGLDMVMARLTSHEIDRVGIWQGMSGSPVYADDGRLIGAVAYGLAWGPSPVAGITPFEDMDDYLDADGCRRSIKVGDEAARAIAADSDVTAAQASQGFEQLPMPLGVSGLSQKRLDQMKKKGPDYLQTARRGGHGCRLGRGRRRAGEPGRGWQPRCRDLLRRHHRRWRRHRHECLRRPPGRLRAPDDVRRQHHARHDAGRRRLRAGGPGRPRLQGRQHGRPGRHHRPGPADRHQRLARRAAAGDRRDVDRHLR